MAKKHLRLDNGKKLRVKLVEESDQVSIIGITEDGDDWFLLALKSDGTFHRSTDIDTLTGLTLTRYGQIEESPEQ